MPFCPTFAKADAAEMSPAGAIMCFLDRLCTARLAATTQGSGLLWQGAWLTKAPRLLQERVRREESLRERAATDNLQMRVYHLGPRSCANRLLSMARERQRSCEGVVVRCNEHVCLETLLEQPPLALNFALAEARENEWHVEL
eukprot:CAMPEP_0119334458 /NCGR_PEP_ID=MMETSP1333-20130426/87368_1 /TAXON_ID=418940 /ORGANISM="Scyphosphaera apsteinii, Strain RCC1455" /LENGTH=142 /DNA_ID=CAMNT_0007344753 /DNA_START=117 /DNA_END=546 /DNA_ORIENTATION=-